VTITARELNRATLARQLLLRREPLGTADAVRRLLALQAQQPASPYLALWNRLDGFDPAELDGWFICGPGPMMDAAEGALLDRNIPKERIHIERFTADRPPEAVAKEIAQLQTQAEGVTVAVTLDGRTRRVPFTQGNFLDSARAAGLPAPFACKAGVCATCRAKVTKGKVEMAARYGLTDEEVADGYVLTCQSVPLGDGVAVDYDA